MSEIKEVTEETMKGLEEAGVAEEVPAQPEQKQLSLDELKVGYIVAMTDDGDFVFELIGKQKGLVELLGLHKHATNRVETLYNQTQMSGDTLVHEVGKAMAMLNQKLDQVAQVILPPKKPDNNL